MNKTNVKTKPSTTHRHDTPNNKTHIIKFRVTEKEKLELENTAKLLHLSLSTLIRRALHNAKIERTVVVVGGGEEGRTAQTENRKAECCVLFPGGRTGAAGEIKECAYDQSENRPGVPVPDSSSDR